MIVGADWRCRCNECPIAKSMVDPKAIAFGGVPSPLATSPIGEPPKVRQLTFGCEAVEMIRAVIFSCSFASVSELVAGIEVAGEDEWCTPMLTGQLQASAEKSGLSAELWEITGQERQALELRKATGVLNGGSRAHNRK
jgi:hypothetical protein